MADVDNKIMTQPELVDYILKRGAEFLGIDLSVVTKPHTRTPQWVCKRYLIVLLKDYTILNDEEIAKALKYRQHGTITHHYKVMKEELSEKMYGQQKTKIIYNQLINYLKLESYENKECNKNKTSGECRESRNTGSIK